MEGPVAQNRNVFANFFSLSWLSKATIVEIISYLFIILFLYTGISKLIEYAVFKEQIAESPILKPVAPFIALALPLAEFVTSILLFVPIYRLKGLYLSFTLMLIFTAYVGLLIAFNKELPCSCGGILELLSWPAHLILNILLTLTISFCIYLKRKRSYNSLHT